VVLVKPARHRLSVALNTEVIDRCQLPEHRAGSGYEVATFYNMYDMKPVGKYKLTVCTNLPCALSGGVNAAEYISKAGHRHWRNQC
jgi:NADH-quinone oxidoreductase subunit E